MSVLRFLSASLCAALLCATFVAPRQAAAAITTEISTSSSFGANLATVSDATRVNTFYYNLSNGAVTTVAPAESTTTDYIKFEGIFVSQNSPGDVGPPANANVLTTQFRATLIGHRDANPSTSGTGTKTNTLLTTSDVFVRVTVDGFVRPTSPADLTNHFTTAVNGAAGTGGASFGPSATSGGTSSLLDPAATVLYTHSDSYTAAGSFDETITAPVSGFSTPFAIREAFNMRLSDSVDRIRTRPVGVGGAGTLSTVHHQQNITATAETNLTQHVSGAVPEPASMAIWGIGAMGMAVFAGVRRRLARAKS